MTSNQTVLIQKRIILLSVIGVVFTSIFVIGSLSIPYYLESKKHTNQELLLHSSNKALITEHLLYQFEEEAKSVSGRIHARHLLARYNRGEINQQYLNDNSLEIISEAIQQAPNIVGVTRIARDGTILLSIGQDIPNDLINFSIISTKLNNTQFGNIVRLSNSDHALLVYSPILGHKGFYLGIDVVAVRIDALQSILQSNKLQSASMLTAFYSENGGLRVNIPNTASSFAAEDGLVLSLARTMHNDNRSSLVASLNNNPNIYALVKVPYCNWVIVSKVNSVELYTPLINRMLVILVVAFVIAVLGAILMQRLMKPLSKRFVEPIEQSRIESEQKYKALFESAGDAIFILQQEEIIDCNQKTLDIFKCLRDDFIGKTLKYLSPECQPDGKNSQDKAIELIANAYQGESQYFEWQFRRLDDTFFPTEVSLSRINIGDNFLLQVMVRDVSERKLAEETIYHMAYHDALTGLVNRHEFEVRMSHALDSAKNRGTENAILYIDLDQFKVVNDSCGHAAGDELLKLIAELLHKPVRERDTVARLGGDEFGILLENCPPPDAMNIANKIIKLVRELRFVWEGNTFTVGVSIGVSLINNANQTVGGVLKTADMACYMSKDLGRNRVHLFTHDDEDLLQRETEMSLVTQIHESLENDKFILYYQPIVSLNNRNENEEFFELFVRMLNKEGSLISASDFVIPAELYNLMPAIDRWVISNAFSHATRKNKTKSDNKQSVYFVNISGTSFNDESLLPFVKEALSKKNLDPSLICFEVTETAAIANITLAKKFIREIKSIGCRFALDDFGSGLSSFAYLKELPVDYLKIDGAFVRDIVDNRKDYSIVEAITQVGRSLEIQTIAEFVENETIIIKLKEIGVDYAQGYAIGVPKSID